MALVDQKGKFKGKKILFWSPECRYDVILNVVKKMGWKLVDDEKMEGRVNMYWVDIATIQERFRTILPWQMINHFPGMPNIARKNRMGQNLNKMQKIFPKEYSFYPRTWVLPAEMGDFRQNFDAQGNSLNGKVFIIKPDAGCQGRGIFLTRTFDTVPQQENVVAQTYIKKPLLLDGFKFDLRIYVLVTCIRPLRVYLFHDGLVRMCTEEYVKPTKQNISMTCMHLTNYAVNKHNTNFVQPSAKSSTDRQDDGSKRSVSWFMNWSREQYGDAKADWLWNRIGVLCIRTILSILPILSREYDQHFKSFNNVPYAPAQQAAAGATSNSNSAGGSSGIKPVPGGSHGGKVQQQQQPSSSSSSLSQHYRGGARQGSPQKSGGAAGGGGGEASETEDEEDGDGEGSQGSGSDRNDDGEDDEDDGNNNNEEPPKKGGGAQSSETKADKEKKEKPREPTTRGSRCFEVLGYDIMIDANLKPWLIEVNHLPSFGTDSPLDHDIKERLMQQVFKVLPVRSDDEQAYIAHHKSEAGKRLTGRSQARAKVDDDDDPKRRDSSGSRPPLDRNKTAPLRKQSEDSSQQQQQQQQQSDVDGSHPESSVTALPSVAGAEDSTSAFFEDEPVTPERLQEIVDTLTEIYMEYSPEKVNKIGRLLQKYVAREEEFLRFVYHKYNITPKPTPKQLAAAAAETEAAKKRANSTSNPAPKPPNGSKDPKKPGTNGRSFTRSLSPPASTRRAHAVWRCAGAEEDLPFRAEVIGAHWPAEDDIWMEREQQLLTEFTRIFPRLPKQSENDAENEDNEGDDADEEGVTAPATNSESVPVTKFKPASYEDVAVQAFVLDKRQTMRLHHPLAARMRPSSQEELPPLDNRSVVLPGGIGSSSGKGVVGWRAPPQKSTEKKEVRVPTQSQLDAAKRLSLGLSVARDGVTVINPRSSKYIGVSPSNVVLDPDVSSQVQGMPGMQQQQQQQVQGQISGMPQQYQAPQASASGGQIPVSVQYPTSGFTNYMEREGGPARGIPTWTGMSPYENASAMRTAGPGTAGVPMSREQYLAAFQQQHQLQQQQLLQQQYSGGHSHFAPTQSYLGAPTAGFSGGGCPAFQPGSSFQQFSAVGSSLNVASLASANQRARLVDEGRQARARLEVARVTPAAVLRQQVYRFVPSDPNNPASGLSIGPPPPQGSLEVPGGFVGATPAIGILGGSVHPAPTSHGTGRPSLDSLPSTRSEPYSSFAQHVQHKKEVRQQQAKSGVVKAVHQEQHPPLTDLTPQDILLRGLFPGWF